MTSTHAAPASNIICCAREKNPFGSAGALSFFVQKVISNEFSQSGLSLCPFSQQSMKITWILLSYLLPPDGSQCIIPTNVKSLTLALTGATFSDCSFLTVLKIGALSSDLGFSSSQFRIACPPPAISLQLMSLLIHLFCLLASIFRLWLSPMSWLFLKQDKCCFTSSFLICSLCLTTWDSSCFNSISSEDIQWRPFAWRPWGLPNSVVWRGKPSTSYFVWDSYYT